MKKFERLFENHNRIIVKPETAEKAATKSFILFFFLFFLFFLQNSRISFY